MKKISLLAVVAVVSLGIVFSSCDSKKSMGSVKLNSTLDSVSYLLGANYGQGLRQSLSTFPDPGNVDAMISGFMNAAKGDSIHLGMDAQTLQMFMDTYFREMSARISEKNLEEGRAFLNENKSKSGVVTTESGLQYKVITEGTGPKPKPEDVVKVHYEGKYIDGTILDSSVQRGEPVEFQVGGVISGWTEALLLMPVGSKYILWIPTELAYGTSRQDVKPNSMLIFEIELLDIVKQ
jgi:FKBP-type peptidyl-prolyl cis-trans isomerases 1